MYIDVFCFHNTGFALLIVILAGGSIPSELCDTTGLSIEVVDTGIHCYSGCLTSAKIVITGATNQCHDGNIMERFLLFMSVVLAVGLISTAYQCFNWDFPSMGSLTDYAWFGAWCQFRVASSSRYLYSLPTTL